MPRTSRSPWKPLAIIGAATLVACTAVALILPGLISPRQQPGPPAAAAIADGVVAESVLPDDTSMGAVSLDAGDLAVMRDFYRDVVGLEVLEESDARAVLGADGEALLTLDASDAQPDAPTEAGLYHTAFLYADRPALAAAVRNIAELSPDSFQGSADHAVSLAFYFGDPEGNGIELYVDRPEDEWEWDAGTVTMGSAALDPNAFIQANAGTSAQPHPIVGHVHLRVGDIAAARAFYEGALGFAVTSIDGSSLFLSAGGYHHHIATNTWSSAGAGQRPEMLGLRTVAVRVPATELDAAAARLDAAGVGSVRDEDSLTVDDPWGNTVLLLSL